MYRCKIPECENGTDSFSYNPDWLPNAVPFESGSPQKCQRYAPYDNHTSGNCSSSDFNQQQILSCDSYVYSTEEVTILQDVSKKLIFLNRVNKLKILLRCLYKDTAQSSATKIIEKLMKNNSMNENIYETAFHGQCA